MPDIDRALKLFDELVGFLPDRSDIDILQLFQIRKLQTSSQYGLRIDWQVFRHSRTPSQTPQEFASPHLLAPSAGKVFLRHSTRYRLCRDVSTEYCQQIPVKIWLPLSFRHIARRSSRYPQRCS